ncbi:MAG: Gfo/Idh/MocA family oxidoreductase [Candidatus Sungbacteria bacterium]|nr:Gfo/Idh/MocA family oxidoreductase [bacterium]MDZ4260455.1 Gfo/Idh/MocA family oxidoreductase [Candidatus Sungbacteria bacterium]
MNLRFGVIGTGYFGRHYVRLLQQIGGAELSAVVSRSETEIADLPATVKRYGSADEMLHNGAIDCVVIATPVSTHAELAIQALENDKHVLLEKPMAGSLVDAERIAAAVEKSGRVFMIGHQYCYNNYIRHLKQEIEAHTLGDIRYLFAEHLYVGPVRLDIGCFWETATHELAMIDYLFSQPNLVKVSGQMVDMSGSGRDDFSSCMLTFDNGLTAAITTTWFAPYKLRRMMLGGANGMALFDENQEHALTLYHHPYPQQESPESHTSHFFNIPEGEKEYPSVAMQEPLANQVEHFIDCVILSKTSRTGVEHGLRITRMLENITDHMR